MLLLSKPELLVPAGNLEKLKIAILYGADAVYAGISAFGLRHYADNFTYAALATGIQFAHKRNKKVYVVLNGMATDTGIRHLKPVLDTVAALNPDAFIIADPGVVALAKPTGIPIHISTQASVTTAAACLFWHQAGAKRIVLAREVGVDACRQIHNQVPVELEVFIHGAMCASYSGKCVISNYTAARDSNRGGCIQSCRHNFGIYDSNKTKLDQKAMMNAQDLLGIHHIYDLMQAGVHSLKIEGRMKSNFYVAQVSYAYRQAIDRLMQNPNACLDDLVLDLKSVSNRTFSDGFLAKRQVACQINSTYSKTRQFIGTVKASDSQYNYVQLKAPLDRRKPLQWLTPQGYKTMACDTVISMQDKPLSEPVIQGNQLVKFKKTVTQYAILTQAV